MDATSFEGFEETVQLYNDLNKIFELKTNSEEYKNAMGQELFWKADISQIQTTVQVLKP